MEEDEHKVFTGEDAVDGSTVSLIVQHDTCLIEIDAMDVDESYNNIVLEGEVLEAFLTFCRDL